MPKKTKKAVCPTEAIDGLPIVYVDEEPYVEIMPIWDQYHYNGSFRIAEDGEDHIYSIFWRWETIFKHYPQCTVPNNEGGYWGAVELEWYNSTLYPWLTEVLPTLK